MPNTGESVSVNTFYGLIPGIADCRETQEAQSSHVDGQQWNPEL